MNKRSLTIPGFLITLALLVIGINLGSASATLTSEPSTDQVSTHPAPGQNLANVKNIPATFERAFDNITAGNLWAKFESRYQAANLKVKLLVAIIFYLLISLVMLLIFIVVNRTIKTRQRVEAEKIKQTYQEELTNFLFDEESQVFEFTGIKHAFNREIFINELLSLHNNLFGESAKRLGDLYFNLELYKDSLKKIDSRQWAVKAKGFRELAQMDVKDAGRKIEKYVNSHNNILRIESQIAMVRLNEDNPLFFFDDLKHELSEWEQINILDALLYHKINIDSFERWMNNPNDSVVIFAIKMAGFFKHIQSWPRVLELLEHSNPDIRREAIKTLDLFEIAENATPFMKTYLKECRLGEMNNDAYFNLNMDRNRLAAIEALRSVATINELPFFEQVLHTEKDFTILKKTVEILSAITPGGPETLNRVYEKSDPVVRRIIENQKQIAAL